MKTTNPFDSAIKSLDEAEEELLNQLKSIREAKQQLLGKSEVSKNEIVKTIDESDYDAEWTVANKFLYLLKKHNRFLHFREAADIIAAIERGDSKKITSQLSTGTSSLKKNGNIVKYVASSSNTDTFWGSPKWLDENGKIKQGHEINTDYLTKSSKTQLFDL
jgi:hypothetical protein